ncbi:hypothetical protein [Dyadobacter sp. NIV53]|uniref:hypothetical protein n=1 Tax=Dyadobacter sp. NIV53 TaxID=2861765 RepID=UPI001C873E72|nr:hypothetical protein [Dyadobacter sp. NIV53]
MLVFTKSLCIFFLIGFLFTGCKKDEEVVPKSIITINGVDYDLSQALLIDYGPFATGQPNAQVLFLSSSGVQFHEVNGKLDSISGVGHAIYFELSGSVPNALTDGEYAFNPFGPPYKGETFLYSYAVFQADFVTFDGEFYEISAGKITVKKEDSQYAISFDCTEIEGKHITGFYKGALKFFDEG